MNHHIYGYQWLRMVEGQSGAAKASPLFTTNRDLSFFLKTPCPNKVIGRSISVAGMCDEKLCSLMAMKLYDPVAIRNPEVRKHHLSPVRSGHSGRTNEGDQGRQSPAKRTFQIGKASRMGRLWFFGVVQVTPSRQIRFRECRSSFQPCCRYLARRCVLAPAIRPLIT